MSNLALFAGLVPLLFGCAWAQSPDLAATPPTAFTFFSETLQGPRVLDHSLDPIWIGDYHRLEIRYRAWGQVPADAPVLTLRSGVVGPITPGAKNLENPLAVGPPVVVWRGGDVAADGASHRASIELRGRATALQVDQLHWDVPAGLKLAIEAVEFQGDESLVPCKAEAPRLPQGATALEAASKYRCAGHAATTLRGQESITLAAGGRKARTLYLSMLGHFPGLQAYRVVYPPGATADSVRAAEVRDPYQVTVRLYYGARVDEAYPLLVDGARYAMRNRVPALYAVALDPSQPLTRVEIADRGPHAQLVLFAAGLSMDAAPVAPSALPPAPRKPTVTAKPDFGDGPFYRIEGPTAGLGAKLEAVRVANGRRLTLSVTNGGKVPAKFRLVYPAVRTQLAPEAADVYYLWPERGSVISNRDADLAANYCNTFPLQFADIFSPAAGAGLAMVMEDRDGAPKRFHLNKKGAVVTAEAFFELTLAPGETFRAPNVLLAEHDGDWHAGFEAYRTWVKSWYKPYGPRPAWLAKAFWARRDYPLGGSGELFDAKRRAYTYDRLLADGAAFGGIDFIDISGWALSETAGRVGDYPVELGGAANFRGNIAKGLRAGVPTGLYFEGYLIDKNSRVGAAHGAEWQLMQANGKGRWWAGDSPELFVCPHVKAWQQFLAKRIADVARETGVSGVYLDEHGFVDDTRRCWSTTHGHAPGAAPLAGEIEMAKAVRAALAEAGRKDVMLYVEEAPPDAQMPYYDAALSIAIPTAQQAGRPLTLNLARFAFPDVRIWDMLSMGVHPRVTIADDYRISLWHGNGLWLKGHAATWYGAGTLAFVKRAHALLHKHAAAFNGEATPLVASPHPQVFVNRFRGGGETVYTLFNAGYTTARFRFQGAERSLAPRDVDVVLVVGGEKAAQ